MKLIPFKDYVIWDEKNICGFFGEYRFLSNFHLSRIEDNGIIYPSVENAYQAYKTLDLSLRKEVFALCLPNEAKKLGQQLDLRPDWENAKLAIMEKLLWKKFENTILEKRLLDTQPKYLEELNAWMDNFYGRDFRSSIGLNHLGKLLMKIRQSKLDSR